MSAEIADANEHHALEGCGRDVAVGVVTALHKSKIGESCDIRVLI
jgi:hypothetical protein